MRECIKSDNIIKLCSNDVVSQNNLYYIRMILSEPTQPNVQNVIPLLCLYVSMFMKFNYS